MRSLLVLIDGLGDTPIPAWQGRTPYEFASHPVMDVLVQNGALGHFSICENDIIPESCSCILRLLGVDKKDIPQNRAYLELLANNRDVSEYEMVLRCNLAAVDDNGCLAAFNGQGLTAEAMKQAAAVCDGILKDIEFIHLSEYRNLLVLNKEAAVLGCAVQPPHESVGQNAAELLAPLQDCSLAISYFLREAKKRLAPFAHDGLQYILYPWGPSARQGLPAFSALHGLRGGAVCKAEIVLGIAKALGMDVLVPQGATGDVDTDIAAKAQSTLQLLAQDDFVIAHFNGSDEAAHRYDYQAKADFISRIDSQFMQTIADSYHEPLRVVVCGDHVTSSVTGKHTAGAVPVLAGFMNTQGRKPEMISYRDILNFLMKESD